MARLIPEDIIVSIQQAADIFDVVSETVQLKKSGQGFMGLCPFHSEKTPSFHVNPQRGIYHCFGCGVGGDVFSFVMKRDGIPFPEAIRMLAGKYGITIPEPAMSEDEKRQVNRRDSLYKANKLAMGYYQKTLFTSPQAEHARTYLKNRGIHGKIAEAFNMGYAPEGWDHMVRFLTSNKISRETGEQSGLIITKNKERYYDRFRNRIIFPILDLSQRVIGFGGRVLDDSLPKYLNSPETLIYAKSKSLYGYNKTKQACRQKEAVHIVEGYFDLISLYMHGVENAVATLGTALTRDHIRMLSRGGVKRFILVFDSDDAGINAALRSIPIFQQEFISANILVLPKGHDPDTFVRDYGGDAFMALSEKALGIVPFLIESAIKEHGLSVEGRINIIDVMKEPLKEVHDPIARSLYIRELAHRIGVDEEAVLEKVKAVQPRPDKRAVQIKPGSGDRNGFAHARYPEMEKQIVSMMLQFPDILDDCKDKGVVDYLENDMLRSLGRKIMDYQGDPQVMASVLMACSDTEDQRRAIAQLAIGDIPWVYKNCVNLIHQFIGNRKKMDHSLSERIRQAEQNNDHDLLIKLMQEKHNDIKLMKDKVYTRRR